MPAPTYIPPQRLLVPCAACGTTVLRGVCVDGKVKKLKTPLTPVLGQPHVCRHGEAPPPETEGHPTAWRRENPKHITDEDTRQ